MTFAVAEVIDPYKTNQTLTADSEPPLPMGTYVSATINGVSMDNVIKVPRGVLRGQNELLFISDENKLQIELVSILRTDQNFAYIDDLSIVDRRISLTAIGSPINGMRVRTTDDPPPAPAESETQEAIAGQQ